MNKLFLDILATWDEVEYVFRGFAVCLCVLFVFRLVSLHMESRARKPFRFCQPSRGSSLRVYAQLTRLYSVLRIYDVAIQCNTPMMSKHMNSGHMSRCSHGRTHQVPCAVQTKSGSRHALGQPHACQPRNCGEEQPSLQEPLRRIYTSDYSDDLPPSQLSFVCPHTCQFKTHEKTRTMAAAAAVYPPLDQRPVKNTVLLFDVDDTLTKPRQVCTLDACSAMLL